MSDAVPTPPSTSPAAAAAATPPRDVDLSLANDRLVWIDLEMTGLDTSRHVIVEIACLITDAQLNVVGEGIDLVVHATDEQLAEMDDFVTNMHTSSGLVDEITASTLTLKEAEDQVIALIKEHCSPFSAPVLAGNSIATDRMFIRAQMPELDKALHYRMIDVTTLKELARRWFPEAYFGQPQKGLAHRALADIIESLRELDYYRRSLFFPSPGLDAEQVATATQGAVDRFADLLTPDTGATPGAHGE